MVVDLKADAIVGALSAVILLGAILWLLAALFINIKRSY